MKTMGDMLLNPGSFSEIVMGNTALVRGMVEAGVKVAASYPGSPTPEIATAIASIPKDEIPIRRLLEGLGVKSIDEVDTYEQEKLKNLVLEARKKKGLRVIIARHPCMLKFTREAALKPGYRKRSVSVDGETCTLRLNCIRDFACPTFQWMDDGRVQTHKDLCIGDGSCMPTCPTKAIRPDKS